MDKKSKSNMEFDKVISSRSKYSIHESSLQLNGIRRQISELGIDRYNIYSLINQVVLFHEVSRMSLTPDQFQIF